MSRLSSDQEEADTKLILHALDANNAGATNLQIHSPDTDVLVRALRRYPQLCENTIFVTGAAQRRRMIPLKLIYDALGEERAAALPGFYAMSGADNTGSFRGKEKPTCWKAFCQSTEDIFKDNEWSPVMSQLPPAPDAILQLVKCACTKTRCSTNRASAEKRDWFAQICANALIQMILATVQPLHKMVKMKMISDSPALEMKMKTLFALFEFCSLFIS